MAEDGSGWERADGGIGESDDGLGPLVLDTAIRAHAPTVVLGVVTALGVAVASALGLGTTWGPAVGLVLVVAGAGRWLGRRADRTDRALVAVLDEP